MPTIEKSPESTVPAGYMVLQEVTCPNINGENKVHLPGTVLSAWEVSEFIKDKIAEGSSRYRARFEPMTEAEVLDHRSKATALEGDRMVDGHQVSPPWDDYIGLAPEEIVERLAKSDDLALVGQVKSYEQGGLNRTLIVDYVAPVERAPWIGYDDLDVRGVLAKLDVLSPEHVSEVLAYEHAHRKRPAILTYEREA